PEHWFHCYHYLHLFNLILKDFLTLDPNEWTAKDSLSKSCMAMVENDATLDRSHTTLNPRWCRWSRTTCLCWSTWSSGRIVHSNATF
ncbi:unnamed protein product, partial [Mycena citricolor]